MAALHHHLCPSVFPSAAPGHVTIACAPCAHLLLVEPGQVGNMDQHPCPPTLSERRETGTPSGEQREQESRERDVWTGRESFGLTERG